MSPKSFSAFLFIAVLSATSFFYTEARAQDAAATAAAPDPTPAPTPANQATAEQRLGPAAIAAIMTENRTLKALAGNLQDDVKRCAKLDELGFRITCADQIARDHGFMTAEKAAAQEKKLGEIGFWQISTQKDPDGLIGTYMRIESSNVLRINGGAERRPVLTISCSPGKTDIILDWKAPVLSRSRLGALRTLSVSYFPNSDAKISEEWQISSDKNALFAPDSVSFVRNILKKKKLTIEVAPNNETVEPVYFDISNVEEVINSVILKNCYQ